MKRLDHFLPRTQSKLLQVTLVTLSAVWCGLGGFAIVSGISLPLSLPVGSVLIAVGIFLWRLDPIACGITKFAIGTLIVVPIIAAVGPCLETPCSYGDFLRFDTFKTYVYLLFVLLAFFAFGVLDWNKEDFRSPVKKKTEDKVG